MAIPLKQSTASQEVVLGVFVDPEDGNTPVTDLTIANTDIKIWKAGATTLTDKNSGGATHIAGGVYYCVLDATDTNTVGPLVIWVHVEDALPVRVECVVYPANVYDSLIAGSDRLQVHADEMTAGLITSSVIAANAIGSSQIAANAIGASELATDAVEEIRDGVWGQAVAEPSGVPEWTTGTALQFLAWLGALALNKMVQTEEETALRNAADDTDIATATVSDDGETFERGAWE